MVIQSCDVTWATKATIIFVKRVGRGGPSEGDGFVLEMVGSYGKLEVFVAAWVEKNEEVYIL